MRLLFLLWSAESIPWISAIALGHVICAITIYNLFQVHLTFVGASKRKTMICYWNVRVQIQSTHVLETSEKHHHSNVVQQDASYFGIHLGLQNNCNQNKRACQKKNQHSTLRKLETAHAIN